MDENFVAGALLEIHSVSTVPEIAKRLAVEGLGVVAAEVAAEVLLVESAAGGLDNVCSCGLSAAGEVVVQQEQAAA